MNERFEKTYFLRTSDFDCRRKLHPASVLDLFQDVAGEHAETLGIGYEAMLAKSLVWVLVKVKYQVLRDAYMYQQVRVRTWPLAPSRIGFQREYLIEDMDGGTLIRGSSEWVLMHVEKRRIMPVRDVYPFADGLDTRPVFDEKLSKLHDFEPDGESYRVLPGFSELDMNRHVNNTKYASFVLDAADPSAGELIDIFQIDYHREVQSGEALDIFIKRGEGEILAKGVSRQGEKMFSCRIALK